MRRSSRKRSVRLAAPVALAVLLAAGLLVAGCAGIEGDIKRAEMREFFANITKGRDRGAGEYLRTIRQHSTKPLGRRYQHRAPAHISQFMIERAVRGLGKTEFTGPDDMAVATDQLIYVAAYDPAAATRALAAEELGHLFGRLPAVPMPPPATKPRADQRINEASQDLFDYSQKIRKGERVTNRQIVNRLEALRAERPPTLISAQQMVRSLASRPVARAAPGPLREWTRKMSPGLLRISIVVALREVAFGDPIRPEFRVDPSPMVRAAAVEALTRIGWPGAVPAAEARLGDPYDPAESDADVQVKALRYLGRVGGPRAFAVALVRLEDPKSAGVRYQAQIALQAMTGERVEPTAAAWRAWQAAHPKWQPRAREGQGAPGADKHAKKSDR